MNATRHNSELMHLTRLRLGWTLKRLSAVTGLSLSACGHVLQGKRSGVKTVKLISEALGLQQSDVWPSDPVDPQGGPGGGITNDTDGGRGPGNGQSAKSPAVSKSIPFPARDMYRKAVNQ